MHVLMVGVDKQTKGGMWTVVENYLNSTEFIATTNLKYISTSITGGKLKRIIFTLKSFIIIIVELISNKYDIVHIHMAEKGSVYRKNLVIILSKFFHCRVILHLHGAEFEKWYINSNQRKRNFVRKVLNKPDKIIILGEYLRNFIETIVIDKSKIFVIYNAVSVPNKNLYNKNATNILFLGVVAQRKGIYDLLMAIKNIDQQLNPSIKLLIYGPDYENKIQNQITNLKIENRVEYKGWLSSSEKALVFNSIAINVLPSYNEGLPMTILETMSYGIPNISTNVAAIPEAINSKNGMLLTPGDIETLSSYILNIMRQRQERISMSNYAYLTARETFSVETHIKEILKLYNHMEKKK